MLFKSFIQAGFECSTHCRPDGKRLDLVAATGHDEHAMWDYCRLKAFEIGTTREGLRWHLIEEKSGVYDFSSALPILEAACETDTQVIWDLFHYGVPSHLDIFSGKFVDHFEEFASRFAQLHHDMTDDVAFICPINEPSFFSWSVADAGNFNPTHVRAGSSGTAMEIKKQLTRANIAAMNAMLEIDSRTRFVHVDPMIHVAPNRKKYGLLAEKRAQEYLELSFQSWDMIAGRQFPELGGKPEYLDILGGNHYLYSQWIHEGAVIGHKHQKSKRLSDILLRLHQRYHRPILLSETGVEGKMRSDWFRYVMREIKEAQECGVQVEGVCMYPITDYPGWEDDRYCSCGLWAYPDENGFREVYSPLGNLIQKWSKNNVGEKSREVSIRTN